MVILTLFEGWESREQHKTTSDVLARFEAFRPEAFHTERTRLS